MRHGGGADGDGWWEDGRMLEERFTGGGDVWCQHVGVTARGTQRNRIKCNK